MTKIFRFCVTKGPPWLTIIALAISVLLTSCSGFPPQAPASAAKLKIDPVFRYKLSEETQIIADQRRSQIDSELKEIGTNHPWAGRYTISGGFEMIALWLAPQSGFLYECVSDHGLIDRNWGSVRCQNGRISMKCELKNDPRNWLTGVGPPLLPVRWGDRQYLIDSTEFLRFCNAVNSGDNARVNRGGFFVRREDARKAFTGLPDVPAKYRKCLLKETMTATVVSTKPSRYEPMGGKLRLRITPATVNAGSAEGVFRGMQFHTIDQSDPLSIEVKYVARHSCRVEFKDLGDTNPLPTNGWRLSSKYDHP